jgi:hypothetical protein
LVWLHVEVQQACALSPLLVSSINNSQRSFAQDKRLHITVPTVERLWLITKTQRMILAALAPFQLNSADSELTKKITSRKRV